MSEQTPSTEETLLTFPCDFAVKAMGETHVDLEAVVLDIVSRHVEAIAADALSSRQSSGGKYTSVTITIRANSKAQLDAIYRELSAHEHIKYVL